MNQLLANVFVFDGDAPAGMSAIDPLVDAALQLRLVGGVPAQEALLQAVWPCLEPGGMLIYSTCSILREENDDVVDRFALQHADARTEPLAVNWGLATARGRQLLPVAAGHDGFFYAALRKS